MDIEHFLRITDKFNKAFMSKLAGLEDDTQPISAYWRTVFFDFGGERKYYPLLEGGGGGDRGAIDTGHFVHRGPDCSAVLV